MKKGFWNFFEPVTYRALTVIIKPVSDPPMHWQNAFVGQERQIIEVSHTLPGNNPPEIRRFYIDNADGSGILKIEAGGGPGSMSRHLDAANFEVVEAPAVDRWNEWSPVKCAEIDAAVDAWQKENCPAEWERLKAYAGRLEQITNEKNG